MSLPKSLTINNIDKSIRLFERLVSDISISEPSTGLGLLNKLKREPIGKHPMYGHVSYFEAANRIMTDAVILKGVKWLLEAPNFPFAEYKVDYGNDNTQDHDVMSEANGSVLVCEAFNVAPSFFQGKKAKMLEKLRQNNSANFSIIMVNEDAVSMNYSPSIKKDEYILLVDIFGNKTRMLPN